MNGSVARVLLEKVAIGVSCFFNFFWKECRGAKLIKIRK